jgi:hypothetical protein
MYIISTQLKYINTLNIQNIIALLDIHHFCQVWNCISAQWKILLKYHKIETPRSVNGDDSSHAPWDINIHMHHNETNISWDYRCWLQQVRICLFRARLWLNILLHIPQLYGRSPVCTGWCNFRLCVLVNVLLHTSQRYGRSPVCTRRWTFRLLVLVNVLLHTLHQYGRSPVCTYRCTFRCSTVLKVLLQKSQGYGRSPVCTRWCIFRFCSFLKVLLQTSQGYGRSSVCTCWCLFR